MNWDINSLNKKKKSWPKIAVIGVVLLVAISGLYFFTGQIKNFCFGVSAPMQMSLSSVGKDSSNWLGSFANAANLNNENKELKKENQKLLAEISNLQSIQGGNVALSTISETCQDNDFTTIMAGITGLDNQDIITINKGSDDGIAEGMPVINQYNVLYGKIFKVYKNFSQVMLISNVNSVINAQIKQTETITDTDTEATATEATATEATATEATATAQFSEQKTIVNGVVKGLGGLKIYLDLVPIDEQIGEGEVLVTSALNRIFPKNILIGKISKVNKDDQKPFQQAEINAFLRLDNIENLFVITNYKNEK